MKINSMALRLIIRAAERDFYAGRMTTDEIIRAANLAMHMERYDEAGQWIELLETAAEYEAHRH